jgi:hypothetical protein
MLVMGVHVEGLASQYISTINIVVKSAAIWVSSVLLHLACLDSFESRPHNLYGPPDFSALSPFFSNLFRITSVILFFFGD